MWNELIKIRDNTKNKEVKEKAGILLSQLNTAAGKEIMRTEILLFLKQNKKDS